MIWVLLLFSFNLFWLSWVFAVACGPSLVAVSGKSLYTCSVVASLVVEQVGSRANGLRSCDAWA